LIVSCHLYFDNDILISFLMIYHKKVNWVNQKLTLPDFIGIGAQKAGTTWLFENLIAHPKIFMPYFKEVHYFNRISDVEGKIHQYSKYFKKAKSDQIVGEITPAYSILAESRVREMKKIMPELKLIFIMRNPIKRAFSHAMMDLTKKMKLPKKEIPPTQLFGHFESAQSRFRGDYLKVISLYERCFGKENICIKFFEEIKECPEQMMNDIYRFLGLEELSDFSQHQIHRVVRDGNNERMGDEYYSYLDALYRKDIEQIQKKYGSYSLNW